MRVQRVTAGSEGRKHCIVHRLRIHKRTLPQSIFSSYRYQNCTGANIMPSDLNLPSHVPSRIKIDFNASILVVAVAISETLAAPVLPLVLHTPFPFPETPPFFPGPNHKRQRCSTPARCPAPSPKVAVLQGKGGGPRLRCGVRKTVVSPSSLRPI